MNKEELARYRNSKFRRELRNSILRHFNLDELKVLAHDLSVNWDAISGETINLKVKELIDYLDRRGSLSELTRELRRERPNVAWPGYPEGTIIHVKFEYSASGKTYDGEPFINSGKADITYGIDGEYFDDGLAFAEAVSTTADHVYIFEVEKKGRFGISELHVSITNLEAGIYLSDSGSE